MKRRSIAGGERIKGRRPKTPEPVRGNAPKGQARSKLSPAIEETEVARLTRELTDERRQRRATSEVLRLLSGSHGDLNHLFDTILVNATNLCQANFGTLSLCEGDAFRIVAMHNVPPGLAELRRREPLVRAGPLLRMAETKRLLHIADYTEYVASHPADSDAAAFAKLTGVRTILEVPMLKDDDVVGAVVIYRTEVRRFDDREMTLIKDFAAQAVIAIENARLLNELRERTSDLTERTADLTEALEQQTATSEVLQVVSSSPGDVEPVFAVMLEKAVRICDAGFGNIYRWDGEALHLVAAHNTPPAFAEDRAQRPETLRNAYISRMVATKSVVHVSDLKAERSYLEHRISAAVAAVELGGVRAFLLVPMLKEDELIGAIILNRPEVRPFTGKQIALVTNFAAQAVIAIENARLLGELRERTEEVVKLNQQLEQRVADQVGEIERMGRLRRFLPPQVADLIVASGTEKQLESHRREITALFCDLRGFTGFTETADAEDVIALLREYHAAIGEKIIKYSGTLERYAGDGVMVVFNDPVPVENPALQAVLMALEMRDAIGALTETWRRWGHEIGFGIGIAHGFATLGTIGFEGRFDYAAIGTVSNVASRLCDEAKPGQILISPRVLTKVENAVKVEPVGEFELKGIRRPLAAYNVLGALDATP
jgi:class 3 adenylate cyclase